MVQCSSARQWSEQQNYAHEQWSLGWHPCGTMQSIARRMTCESVLRKQPVYAASLLAAYARSQHNRLCTCQHAVLLEEPCIICSTAQKAGLQTVQLAAEGLALLQHAGHAERKAARRCAALTEHAHQAPAAQWR